MSQTMSFKTKLKLLFKKHRSLTDDEKAIVKSIANRIMWGMVLIVVAMICMGYYTIFRDNPAGPTRDVMLQIANAMTISLASAFIGFRIVAWAARMPPGRAIPVAVLAAAFAVVGNSTLSDVALRLKSDVARAEVRGPALVKLGKIMRPNGRPQDIDAFIQESAAYVRALQDPQKIREMHAETDRLLERYRK
jgi:hypothetical protein